MEGLLVSTRAGRDRSQDGCVDVRREHHVLGKTHVDVALGRDLQDEAVQGAVRARRRGGVKVVPRAPSLIRALLRRFASLELQLLGWQCGQRARPQRGREPLQEGLQFSWSPLVRGLRRSAEPLVDKRISALLDDFGQMLRPVSGAFNWVNLSATHGCPRSTSRPFGTAYVGRYRELVRRATCCR